MAIGKLTVVSGTAATEQDFITAVDNILVQACGWELVVKVTNTATNRDFWWRSEGEVSGKYMPMFCSLQGTTDLVILEGATYVTAAGVVSDLMNSAVEGRMSWPNQRDYWVAGSKDYVHIFARDASNSHRSGGFGYLQTYYSKREDPYPVSVYGQSSATQTFAANNRVIAYTMQSLAMSMGDGAFGGGFLGTVGSGSANFFRADDFSTILQYNAPSIRDGRRSAFRIVPYLTNTVSLFTPEVRGEMPYLWQVWGAGLSIGNIITASGILWDSNEVTSSSEFIVTNEFNVNTNTFMIGPIEHFDNQLISRPYKISSLALYLNANVGIERNGGAFHGGRVSTWRDFSSHPSNQTPNRRDAVQVTAGNQPEPRDSVINGCSVVTFSGAGQRYLTGTVPVANDMTLFAVASYSNGSSRTPIVNIRGNVTAQDTLFSIEFNENTNNSATIVNIGGGGTDRVQVTGLTSGQPYILTNTVSGTTSTLYLNGFSESSSDVNNTKGSVTGTATINYSVGVSLNSGGTTGSVFATANVAEVIVYNRYLTNQERQSIHCMLSQKYGVVVSGTC